MTLTLTRPQLEAARTKLLSQGVLLVGDSGSVTHDGVMITYAYFGGTLTVEVRKKPIIFSDAFVESKISKWFSQEVTQ